MQATSSVPDLAARLVDALGTGPKTRDRLVVMLGIQRTTVYDSLARLAGGRGAEVSRAHPVRPQPPTSVLHVVARVKKKNHRIIRTVRRTRRDPLTT